MRLSREAALKVRHERARLGLSFRKVAETSGVSVSTWQRIEKGEEVAYASLVQAVVALGWDSTAADQLVAGEQIAEQTGKRAGPLDGCTVEVAIALDSGLSTEAKDVLLRVYRGFVGG